VGLFAKSQIYEKISGIVSQPTKDVTFVVGLFAKSQTYEKISGILLQSTKNAVYLDLIVSAYATELGITLGQLAVNEKTNEIPRATNLTKLRIMSQIYIKE
jgi:hypothetical protein